MFSLHCSLRSHTNTAKKRSKSCFITPPIKMLKTFGYYLFEEKFRKYHAWTTSRGLRGFFPTVLMLVHFVWGIYPLIIEIKNYQVNFGPCLVHIEYSITGALLLFNNVQVLRNRDGLFKMIDLFSDFNHFGKPKMNPFFVKNLKILLKSIRFVAFLTAHLVVAILLTDDDCIAFKSTKYCSLIPYYLPFGAKRWEITLVMLFHVYVITVTLNILLLIILLYCYSLDLIVARIKHLNEIIDEVNLSGNKKNNISTLREIVLHQQHIFKMFQLAYNFFTSLFVPTKICIEAAVCLSCTDFFLRRKLISFLVMVFNFSSVFLVNTIGQRLTTASNKLEEAIYDLNWYEADVETRRYVLFLLLITQKELKIELPLFGELSHKALANDCKKDYIFINWLLTITTPRNISI